MLVILGVEEEEIVASYAESCAFLPVDDNPGAKIEHLMRSFPEGMRQIFIRGSPPSVMRSALKYLDQFHGGVFQYLDNLGFRAEWRERLRRVLLEGYGG
mmetsp:Transcript_38159/g.59562  ORF Transcript_38159/g.59562 Transcript_38159/m.59562 type:complete len:99 (-) Transcript_38159:2-298(-)